MTKEQQKIFDKLFSDFETIKRFNLYKLSENEERAYDDVYSIIDGVYCASSYDTLDADNIDYLHIIRQNIKKQYNNSLGLWCSGQYLETLEQWHDYILYNY